MSIYSGAIRTQSRKFSEIAPDFDVFGPVKFCCGTLSKNLYPHYHARLAPPRLVKFREGIPTNPEVMDTHMLNFMQIV